MSHVSWPDSIAKLRLTELAPFCWSGYLLFTGHNHGASAADLEVPEAKPGLREPSRLGRGADAKGLLSPGRPWRVSWLGRPTNGSPPRLLLGCRERAKKAAAKHGLVSSLVVWRLCRCSRRAQQIRRSSTYRCSRCLEQLNTSVTLLSIHPGLVRRVHVLPGSSQALQPQGKCEFKVASWLIRIAAKPIARFPA